MWVVCQANDPFVCFGAKANKGLGLEISNKTGSGGGKAGLREARELVGEERSREESRMDSGRDQSRWVSSPESTTVSRRKQWEKTSQDELAFLVAL